MVSLLNIIPAVEFLRTNQAAGLVFRAIQQPSSISGWRLAKETQMDPDELESILSELQRLGLIRSDGSGLDAFFYLTSMGFQYGSL